MNEEIKILEAEDEAIDAQKMLNNQE